MTRVKSPLLPVLIWAAMHSDSECERCEVRIEAQPEACGSTQRVREAWMLHDHCCSVCAVAVAGALETVCRAVICGRRPTWGGAWLHVSWHMPLPTEGRLGAGLVAGGPAGVS